ncbi:glucokinase [Sphingomonas morindae]|uniref:Glucokinase n=1 Tax=Sphingomonas morindae TaxID=1541170 RepID=A0ABY4X6B4_9SPHN|nr:glucokinase [Sphingomonas morindae]USI72414.1 glucokinase [Sphingomonas morindae]
MEATELVAVDIGGTNARFAIAQVEPDGSIELGEVVTLGTKDYASLRTAWEAFGQRLGRPLPSAGAISFAGPVDGEVLKLTNSPWVVRKNLIQSRLGLDRYVVVNDFGAVGYAVSRLKPQHLRHICGPDVPLPPEGLISILGPGTGLGVAQLLRANGYVHVIETEGGHIDFAPLDPLEDRILSRLRLRYRRVSIERLVSGPGLSNIHEALASIEGRNVTVGDDISLWKLALQGDDALAAAALDRFCLALGSFAGDMALAHGAVATVIGGGIGARVADHLPNSGFHGRYAAKGRFEARMNNIPVKLITHEQPGLLGAAAAFAEKFCR